MSKCIRLCATAELKPGEVKKFDVQHVEMIAVYQVDDEYYATSDMCSHEQASLSEDGYLDGYIIECGWHSCKFDVRTGEHLSIPCNKSINAYSLRIFENDIYIATDPLKIEQPTE